MVPLDNDDRRPARLLEDCVHCLQHPLVGILKLAGVQRFVLLLCDFAKLEQFRGIRLVIWVRGVDRLAIRSKNKGRMRRQYMREYEFRIMKARNRFEIMEGRE